MKKIAYFIIVVIILTMFPCNVVLSANHDPYAGIEATQYDKAVGTSSIFKTDSRGFVANLRGSAYIVFENVDFGKVAPDFVEVYCGVDETDAGQLEIRADAPNGTLVASINVNPGEWAIGSPNNARIQTKLTGVHNLYVSNSKKVCNIFKIIFYEPIENEKGYEEYEENECFADITDNLYKYEIYTLIELGLLEGFTENRYEPNLGVTRGDYASILYKILSSGDYTPKGTIFLDVPESNENFAAISYLQALGIVSSTTDCLFNPYDYITINDAIVMNVRALGFEKIAQQKGGYPMGHLAVGNEEGLLKDLNEEKHLYRDYLAKLIFNFINADYLNFSTIGNDGMGYVRKTGILSKTKQIFKGSGIVSATNLTNLISPISSLDSEQVNIGSLDFQIGNTNAPGLLGYDTNYYYQEKDEERVLISIRPKQSVSTLSLCIQNDMQIICLNESNLIYIDNSGKETTVSFTKNTNFIYNGKAIDNSLADTLIDGDFRGKIRYIENGNDQNTVLINQYVNIVVGSIDTSEQIVYDENTNKGYDLNPNKGSILISKDGLKSNFRDIKPGMVLTIYQSKNKTGKKLNRLIIETKTINGMVTEIDEEKVFIEGKFYRLAQRANKDIYLGLSAIFYLNHANEIVTYKLKISDDDIVGLLLDYSNKASDGLKPLQEIKIFTKEGKCIIYTCAKNIVIDGAKCKDVQQVIEGTGDFAGLKNVNKDTLVRYRLNEDGKIVMLDTYLSGTKNADDILTKLSQTRTTYYLNTNLHTLVLSGGKNIFPYEVEPQVFTFGTEGDEDSLKYYDKISTDTYTEITIDGDVYTLDPENPCVQYVVWYGRSNTAKWKKPFVFDKMNSFIDEDGNEYYKIFGINGNEKLEYMVEKTSLNLSSKESLKVLLTNAQKGDVMRFKISLQRKVEEGQLIFLHNEDITLESLATCVNVDSGLYGTDTYQYTRFIYGTVAEKFGNFIKVKYKNSNSITEIEEFVYLNSKLVEYDYNGGEPRLKNGLTSSNLLIDDKVLICINDREVSLIVIYNHPNL